MDESFCNQSWCLDYETEWLDDEYVDWGDTGDDMTSQSVPIPHMIHVFDILTLCVANGSILANGSVIFIYLLLMKKTMKKIPNMMLMNQALVDIVVSIYAILTVVPNHMTSLRMNMVYRTVAMVLGYYTVFLSLGILLLTS